MLLPKLRILAVGLAISSFLILCDISRAQCAGAWQSMGGMTGNDPATTSVGAMTMWDPDGPGPNPPVLVAGGFFTAAGGTPAMNIAKWDGESWSPLGLGVSGPVDALAVLPDGRLVAAGVFPAAGGSPAGNIAVWDGTAWSRLGTGTDNEIFALTVSHTGELFAGGLFSTAGGVACNHVARWNGPAWSSLGSGAQNGVTGVVYALGVRPNNEIVVGGSFTNAGGSLYRYIARWNGTSWSSVGASISSAVLALAVAPNGDVVAGGLFSAGGAGRIARWNGSAWSTLGTGLNMQPLCLSVQEDGSVIAGGWFSAAGGIAANKIARWDGVSWSTFGIGVDSYIIAQAMLPGGDLVVGGGFTTAGGSPSPAIARWSTPAGFTIAQQPASATACVSGAAAFAVGVSGGPAAFRWQAQFPSGVWSDLSDGSLQYNAIAVCEVTGATSDILHLSAARPLASIGGSLELRCVVSDACASMPSGAATFRVCIADFDCSETLAVQDIFSFLSAWFAGEVGADVNASGALSVQDIFDFLGAWFAGC